MNNIINLEKIRLRCRNCSLSELCLPRGLSSEDLDKFEEIISPHRTVLRGETLYNDSDKISALFAVRSGSLKSVITTEEGDEQIVGFHMPGEIVGFDGIDDVHSCSVVSLEETYVCELPIKDLDRLTLAIPSLHKEISAIMRREITQEQSMLLVLAQRPADSRLATFLLSLSGRLGKRGFSETEFELSMTRHDIANYLGLSPETISRLIRRFQGAGFVKVNRRIVHIINMEALENMVGKGAIRGNRRNADACV
ncbi:MAG: CRP/FNR family transcriptional regulator [Parasphingorhabdus sp.]|jgi:CRP/FNR family transcriptional regulator